ncbi:twin-arginine translocase subunit TatC [Candidatus Poseidoniaceae archaeon]|jgi:sec-independent protein translocase protein TatC|nr:twin-arginine translocase subunit TatC [Euryarchaeota archaeon]MDA9117216.1 twin-arginine translocase subunit TatC [Candidatus Poseidoniaceae archaeon]|tara:strand:+ start:2653 stop:3468 length:816 start_codon:yes stop_codon:yes gene_type:complete
MAGTDELAITVNELLESPGGRLLLDIKAHLRRRFRLLAVVFGLMFVICFPVTSSFISWLISAERLPDGVNIIVITPVEFILLQVKLAAYCAAFTVLTLLLSEGAWRGSKNPAFKQRMLEIKASTPKPSMALMSTLIGVLALGLLGVAYAWNLLTPMLLEYLTTDAQNAGLSTEWRLSGYVGFIANLAIASAIGFQAPVATLLVLRLEVVAREDVRGYRRHIWFTAFILGAFLSPPDPLSLFLVALPVIVLFEAALMLDSLTRSVPASQAQA